MKEKENKEKENYDDLYIEEDNYDAQKDYDNQYK